MIMVVLVGDFLGDILGSSPLIYIGFLGNAPRNILG